MNVIIVYSKDKVSHDKALRAVFKTLENAGLIVNKDKCSFSKNSIDFLGHEISSLGVRPSNSKLVVAKSLRASTSKTKLMALLGLLNYFMRFVRRFQNMQFRCMIY